MWYRMKVLESVYVTFWSIAKLLTATKQRSPYLWIIYNFKLSEHIFYVEPSELNYYVFIVSFYICGGKCITLINRCDR